MKPSEDLFHLIKSLSKSEKRYFHIHFSEEKIYKKIFNLIEKQEEYNEKEIYEKLKINQIHVYKNYLYKQVLKSLRSFHAESSDSIIIYNNLHNFEILFNKGLQKQAKKALIKSKALAQATHKKFLLAEILQIEQKLIFQMPQRKEDQLNMDLLKQQEVLKEELAVVQGQQMAFQISRHFYKSGLLINEEIKKDINYISNSVDEIISGSNRFLVYKYWVKYLFNWMTGNFYDAFSAAEQFIDIIDHSNTSFDLSILSCEVAYCHARCTIKVKEINEYFVINKCFPENFLIKLPAGHLAEDVIKIMNLFLFYEVGKYQEGLEYLNNIKFLDQDSPGEAKIVTFHAACTLNYCAGNYKEALKYCNKIINECTPGMADDFYIVNLFIRIIIHFELHNYDVADDLIKKIKPPLKRFNFFYPFDEVFLKKLEEAMVAKTKAEFCLRMQELLSQFETLAPQFENIIKLKIYFNFKDWIRSKASDITFIEAIQETNKNLLLQSPIRP